MFPYTEKDNEYDKTFKIPICNTKHTENTKKHFQNPTFSKINIPPINNINGQRFMLVCMTYLYILYILYIGPHYSTQFSATQLGQCTTRSLEAVGGIVLPAAGNTFPTPVRWSDGSWYWYIRRPPPGGRACESLSVKKP